MNEKKVITTAFLGCGNIGSGTWRLIEEMHDEWLRQYGIEFNVKKVLVRNVAKARGCQVPTQVLTSDPQEIFGDDTISLVCEFMGGELPAAKYMLRALEKGKSVVTANKMALCLHMQELEEAAKSSGAGLFYEASVCGAIPIISALTGSLRGNSISGIMGIINGTTNYILSSMYKTGEKYEDVLAAAQSLGLAEPDPSSDVEGTDAAYKLAIMASLAFHTHVQVQDVLVQGISHVSPLDITYGKEMGYVLKLIAIGKKSGNTVQVRVHPTFLMKEHPLATVDGSFNGVFLRGNAFRELMLQGRGAGDYPTASAITGDMIAAATMPPVYPDTDQKTMIAQDWVSRFFIRLSANDEPGVLSIVSGALAKEGVSIATMLQKGRAMDGRVPLIFITHEARESSLMKALGTIDERIAHVESVYDIQD